MPFILLLPVHVGTERWCGKCARGEAGRGVVFTEEIKIREWNREVRLEKGLVGRVEHV